ncbi:cytoplasmic dynein 2 heavy chain 1-like [Salvelinus namaycush]|uniref:Cytoplasmic dynein 2 heavy chain 1-like n=1 Tax=Salvelinus namaycush TaxID=8040 RepID=A0A8U0TV73_SALNM|nr:cytoplasmic dynein 2 heavy chain 1-like [Salvelinus namaycush]
MGGVLSGGDTRSNVLTGAAAPHRALTLATAQGNILENKELIDSLNQTKSSSALIQDSLRESHRLQASLDQERDAYLPLAESASKIYFVITDLSRINNMYRFSLASFLRLFQRALQSKKTPLTSH